MQLLYKVVGTQSILTYSRLGCNSQSGLPTNAAPRIHRIH